MNQKLSQIHIDLFDSLGLGQSEIKFIEKNQLPKTDRELLAHGNDMTPTLNKYFASSIYLSVISKKIVGDTMTREVLLRLTKNDQIVEYGGIQINLDLFQNEAREKVEEAYTPLGQILEDFNIAHFGRPNHFFEIKNNTKLKGHFKDCFAEILYGRCNIIYLKENLPLAYIIEILPFFNERNQ